MLLFLLTKVFRVKISNNAEAVALSLLNDPDSWIEGEGISSLLTHAPSGIRITNYEAIPNGYSYLSVNIGYERGLISLSQTDRLYIYTSIKEWRKSNTKIKNKLGKYFNYTRVELEEALSQLIVDNAAMALISSNKIIREKAEEMIK